VLDEREELLSGEEHVEAESDEGGRESIDEGGEIFLRKLEESSAGAQSERGEASDRGKDLKEGWEGDAAVEVEGEPSNIGVAGQVDWCLFIVGEGESVDRRGARSKDLEKSVCLAGEGGVCFEPTKVKLRQLPPTSNKAPRARLGHP
jgi:hypothetical protein